MKIKKNISIQSILKGKFLIKENAADHWKFIVFLILIALITITSSHIVDNKIHELSLWREKVIELQSEYVSVHKDFMQMQLESKVKKMVASKGIKSLEKPPYGLKME